MSTNYRNKIGVVTVILLSILSYWFFKHNTSGTMKKELFDFQVEDTIAITKIYMINSNGKELTLTKTGQGNWNVNGKFKARNDAINNLLVCIKDMQVRQPVAKSAIESVSKQLATTATKVEIYKQEKLEKVYYVGGDTQDGLGTFMLLSDCQTGENSITPFIMFIPGFNGFLSIRYFMDEELWRERSVFAFLPDNISSISVKYTHFPDTSFTINLENSNSISVLNNKGKTIENLDTLKTKRYITYYSNIQYESLANNIRPTLRDSIIALGPVHVIELKDKTGKTHILKTYSKPALEYKVDPVTGKPDAEDYERMYAEINDGKDLALIQYFVFGKLFVSSSWFIKSNHTKPKIGVKK